MHALRVLIVDDVYIMRNLIRKILEEAGHTIVGEAKDGEEGVAMFHELQPDLVTMDVNMPIMDGLTALRHIRKLDPVVPVLTISGVRNNEVEEEMFAAGSYSFVRKPFQPAYLLRRIEDIEPRSRENPKSSVEVYEEVSGSEGIVQPFTQQPLSQVVEPLPSEAEDDLLDEFNDSMDMDVEFDLKNEPEQLPDPVLIVENASDSIVIEYEGDTDGQAAATLRDKHALRPPLESDDAVIFDDLGEDEAVELHVVERTRPPERPQSLPQRPAPIVEPSRIPERMPMPELDPIYEPRIEPTVDKIEVIRQQSNKKESPIRPMRNEPPIYQEPTYSKEKAPAPPAAPVAPLPPRNSRFHETPERLREMREREIEEQDAYDLVIYNAEPEQARDSKPSLWKTILSLFKK